MDRASLPNQGGRANGNPGRLPESAPNNEGKEDTVNSSLIAALLREQSSQTERHSTQSWTPPQNLGLDQANACISLQNALRMFSPSAALPSLHSNPASAPSILSPSNRIPNSSFQAHMLSQLLAVQQTRPFFFPPNPGPVLQSRSPLERTLLQQLGAGNTFPGTGSSAGLPHDHSQVRMRQGVQQLQVHGPLREAQQRFDDADSAESLANRLLTSGAVPSSSPVFASIPSLPRQFRAEHPSVLSAASLLGDLSRSTNYTTTSEPGASRGEVGTPQVSQESDHVGGKAGSLSRLGESHGKKEGNRQVERDRDDTEAPTDIGFINITEEPPPKRRKRAYHHESFPVKLHRLLRETEEAGKTDIISFTEDGKQFRVYKPTEFESEILPKYFRHNQLSSFRRLLNMYGFDRLQEGAAGGTFRHPKFIKGKPELCKDLDRVR